MTSDHFLKDLRNVKAVKQRDKQKLIEPQIFFFVHNEVILRVNDVKTAEISGEIAG